MLAIRQFFGKRAGSRRDFREERGDFTIPLMIFSVVLITAATVAYTWPKSTSTRFTTQHVATQALRAGIVAVSDDAVAGRSTSENICNAREADSSLTATLAWRHCVYENICHAREAAQSVIDDYRIHGVVMDIADPTIAAIGVFDEDRPEDCEDLTQDEMIYLSTAYPRCVPLSNGEVYLILTINWHFTNPGSLVGTQVASRASAQEPIPPALVERLCRS